MNDATDRIPSRPWLVLATPFACIVIGGVIGFMIGRFGFQSMTFSYRSEWDISRILQALATLGVAVYVYHFATERNRSASDIRQHVVSVTRGVIEPLRILHDLTRNRKATVNEVAAAIRAVNTATAEIRDVIAACGSKCDISQLDNHIRSYRQAIDNFPAEEMQFQQQLRLDRHYSETRRRINRVILTIYMG
jgi:hypothetical protein